MIRQFGAYSFQHVCTIEPEHTTEGDIVLFYPQPAYRNRRGLLLHAYGEGPFCRFRIANNLPYEGVYILTIDDDPYYVGECVHLSSRYNMGYGQISPRNCYTGGQATNCRINHLICSTIQQHRVDLWFLQTVERKQVEAELIQALHTRQKWNRKD